MSIVDNLNNLQTNIENAKSILVNNLTEKGVTSATTSSTLTVLATSVADIPNSGGGGKFLCPEHISFSGSSNTTEIDFTNLDTSNVTKMSSMFKGCQYLTSLDLTPFDTSNVTDMDAMFSYCFSLKTLDLTPFDTSNVTKMSSMFSNCTSLTSLNLSSFNTSNVTTMSSMFSECTSLKTLDLTNFNTSNVTSMGRMFENCYTETLDLSGWDTSNVKIESNSYSRPFYAFKGKYLILGDKCKFENEKYFNNMFNGCSYLTTLDLSNWNIPNATTMENMFNSCSNLTSLDLSSFDTSNVTKMSSMFYGCSGLASLDLSNFNTSNVTNMNQMFSYCNNLTEIHWKNFGNGSGYTSVSFSASSKLGVNTTDYPNARQSLVDTLITYSFDRATAGYPTCTVTLSTTTKALLSEDEIAAITAKGFTIA